MAERDEKINSLQGNLEQLSNAQLENTKDKVALCAELTEVCNQKNELNNYLAVETQKRIHLDESKKELECIAITKVISVIVLNKIFVCKLIMF